MTVQASRISFALMVTERVRNLIKRKGIRFLDVKYTDVPGRLHHVTVPIERLGTVMRDGIGFDASSVAGFETVETGDMCLSPDLDTVFVEPFAEQPTLSCFADIRNPTTGKPYERDPREILGRALKLARKRMRCDEVMFLPEFEFYLFDKVEYYSDKSTVYYRLESRELTRDDKSGYILVDSGYHAAPPFDRSTDLRSRICRICAECGMPMKYHHHEGGRFSHVELEPEFRPGLAAADGVILGKYIIKNAALADGRTATFMPKPILGEPGSGMHFHQYAARKGVSLFGDRRSPAKLSRLARYYIGGILEHARSLCAFTNPSTNSFKRLTPGYEAPTLAFFSIGNRAAAIRIPGYVLDVNRTEMEYRIPDGTCNPYLAMAAMVLAGVDGVVRKIDPGMPFKGNLKDAKRKFGSRTLPRILPDALAALNKDGGYLRQDDVFTEGLLDFWHKYKQAEAESVMLRPHPWEYNLYYGC